MWSSLLRLVGRWLLAAVLLIAGVSHFTRASEFLAQVPPFFPMREAIVAVSGLVEISLAVALIALARWRVQVGWIVAAFFVIVFPGNISQLLTGTAAFGLDSPTARAIRLLFQPVLVIWALWCTGAWSAWRAHRRSRNAARRAQPGGEVPA